MQQWNRVWVAKRLAERRERMQREKESDEGQATDRIMEDFTVLRRGSWIQ